MKNHLKYILAFGMGTSVLTSCKRELLNPTPQTSVSATNAFDTPDRILNQVRAIYAAMKNGNFYGGRYVVYGDIRGEDFINQTSNLVTGADVWNLNPTNGSTNSVVNLWTQAYLTINSANLFIDGMTAKGSTVVDATTAKNYIAEAKFARALSYYSLLQLYARPYADGNGNKPGLPLRLTGISTPGSSDLKRSTVAEVYAQILNDLDFAEANLPASYPTAVNNTTRAHKNTAISLKTRVYLSMQQYDKVITEANKIVPAAAPFTATGGGVANALQADITNVFKSPYTTTESILSMPKSTTSGDNPGTQNQLAYYYYIQSSTPGVGEYYLNASGIIADASWTATDKRRSFIFTHSSGRKYMSKYTTPSPFTDYVPVMRWSEVLLNLAEARARVTNSVDAQAVALLNAVRNRSDASTTFTVASFATATDLINAILKERRIEFLGEGLRNNDLMRLLQTIPAKGSAQSKAPGDVGYIWPIPSTELSLNHQMTDN